MNKSYRTLFNFITIFALLFFGNVTVDAQCGRIPDLLSVTEIDQGGGQCHFQVEVGVNNSGGTGNASANYSIQLDDGTELGDGCVTNIVNPGRVEMLMTTTTAACGSNINVQYIGRPSPSCGGNMCNGIQFAMRPAPQNVELVKFNAYHEKTDVMLEWITQTETDNDFFEIEHSADGRTFDVIEKVDGNGTTTDVQVYQFKHQFPVNGVNYYRLKQTDFDRSTTHSGVISIELATKEIIHVFPTTVDSELNIKIFDTIVEHTPVSIYNTVGNKIGSYIINAGDTSLQIPTSNLTAGLYYLKIKLQGQGVITKPFFKKTL